MLKRRTRLKAEDKAVRELIDDQYLKERIAIRRRGWCIDQATNCFCDEVDPKDLIAMAEAIFSWVYSDNPEEIDSPLEE